MSAFFRTSGGSILELDVPAKGTHAGDLHAEKVEKGELIEIDPGLVETVEEQYGVDPRTGDKLMSSRLALKSDRKAKPKEHDFEPSQAAHVAAGPVEIVERNGPVMAPRYVEPFEIDATDVEDPAQVVPLDDDGDPDDADGPPKGNAKKADWVAWAVANGADPDEAEASTVADLRDQYGG